MAKKSPGSKKFPEHTAKSIGMTIKFKRRLLKKTQTALAQEARISIKHLRAIEHGKVLPSRVEHAAIKTLLKAAGKKLA